MRGFGFADGGEVLSHHFGLREELVVVVGDLGSAVDRRRCFCIPMNGWNSWPCMGGKIGQVSSGRAEVSQMMEWSCVAVAAVQWFGARCEQRA